MRVSAHRAAHSLPVHASPIGWWARRREGGAGCATSAAPDEESRARFFFPQSPPRSLLNNKPWPSPCSSSPPRPWPACSRLWGPWCVCVWCVGVVLAGRGETRSESERDFSPSHFRSTAAPHPHETLALLTRAHAHTVAHPTPPQDHGWLAALLDAPGESGGVREREGRRVGAALSPLSRTRALSRASLTPSSGAHHHLVLHHRRRR